MHPPANKPEAMLVCLARQMRHQPTQHTPHDRAQHLRPQQRCVEGAEDPPSSVVCVGPDNTFSYFLKNDNEDGKQKIWRYQHYRSFSPYLQKRALLNACLKKVHKMASDKHVLKKSAFDKINEFQRLQYPRHMLKSACTFVAASLGVREWLDVRDQI